MSTHACLLSHFSHVQLFAILWTVACQASLSIGSSRQGYWSGLPFPPPEDLPNPGTEPASLMSPALAGGFFTTSATWEALICCYSVAKSYSTLCHFMDCSTLRSLSLTISWNFLKRMFIELIMPSNHLILCHPLFLLPSIFPSIRVFSNELALHIRWPNYWNFSFSISLSFSFDCFDLFAV